jgi:hypothetical protein
MNANKTDEISVVDLLSRSIDVADAILRLATDYKEAMGGGATPPVVGINGFYLTYNGSLVCVVKRRSKCRCPQCTGAGGPGGIFGVMIAGMFGGNVVASSGEAVPAAAEHEEASDEPDGFVVSVIKGGHGVKSLRGEGAGETYLVNSDGHVLLQDLDPDERRNRLDRNLIILAGMTLKRAVKVEMKTDGGL